jgi:hypothetical protein
MLNIMIILTQSDIQKGHCTQIWDIKELSNDCMRGHWA